MNTNRLESYQNICSDWAAKQLEINPDILSVDQSLYVQLTMVNIYVVEINGFFLQDKPPAIKVKHHSDFTFWKTLMKNLKKQQKQDEINALRPLEMEQRYVS